MVDFIFQERSTGVNINISEASCNWKPNESAFVKFRIGYTGEIGIDATAQYLDNASNVIIEGKIKIANEVEKDLYTDKRIYEITLYDYGYNLKDGNVNEVFRSISPESIISSLVVDAGLTFINQYGSSGLTLTKKVYRDKKPMEIVNELCDTLGAYWRVIGTNFYLYKIGIAVCSEIINENTDWNIKASWVDDTDKMANTVIVQGATITQRTTETLTGTGTEFYTTYTPNDVEIAGLTQTTDTIDGDYVVDTQAKKITFDTSKTNPSVSYTYDSQIRVQVGFGDLPIKILKKSYIETRNEARKLGRKYYELYKDGISSASFVNVDLPNLNMNNFRCGDLISYVSSKNTAREGVYTISSIKRNFPKNVEIKIGENENTIYDQQAESKDRLNQLEAEDNNSEFSQLDIPLNGSVKVKVTGELTKYRVVTNTGEILWASDTTLSNDADLISDTGLDVDYAISYDEDGLPSGSFVDYV